MDSMNADHYLSRLGVDPVTVAADLDTLERLQTAHVFAVPFETLAITGHPYGDRPGEGVSLALSDIYEKIVERGRGGFCYELNGLFAWLLRELGYDADRLAGSVLVDGEPRPPANHHAIGVSLDGRRYVVDVGLGAPKLRRPIPLDGAPRTDGSGVEWRVVESDRPDADYSAQFRYAATDGDARDWSDRYVFTDEPRELSYFQATCDYLTAAPESLFTGDPFVIVATDRGYTKLTADTLTRSVDGDERRENVGEDDWDDVLATEFGLPYPSATGRSERT